MISKFTNKLCLILVLLALLANGSPSVAFVGEANFSTPAKNMPVTGNCQEGQVAVVQLKRESRKRCGDDDCAGDGCCGVSALIMYRDRFQYRRASPRS